MSWGFCAKFVISLIGDILSTSLSSPTLIVTSILSPTFAEIFVISESFMFKTNVSSEFIEIIISSWMWGGNVVTSLGSS